MFKFIIIIIGNVILSYQKQNFCILKIVHGYRVVPVNHHMKLQIDITPIIGTYSPAFTWRSVLSRNCLEYLPTYYFDCPKWIKWGIKQITYPQNFLSAHRGNVTPEIISWVVIDLILLLLEIVQCRFIRSVTSNFWQTIFLI